MLEKTRGIVLHKIKYTDSGTIVQMYTRKFGRNSFLIKGIRSRKAGNHITFLQPMFILDLDIYYKQSREMQVVKEFSPVFTPYDIYSNIKKSSIAIFLAEVLASVLKEESPFDEMYGYIEDSVRYFDDCREGFANFHIAFLSGLSSYLGFEPSVRHSKDDSFFDMSNGIFVPLQPLHGNYANEEISSILAEFFSSSYDSVNRIQLSGKTRNEVLETLIKYYSLHLPGLKSIRSLEVLKEVFS